ncbi:hypothetical protein EB796_016550 [Bugula neritina]|uniref:Uncharacterized protein n=1 Tax=Bugula neritina TaxID=10212 RepID=A0A7J7JFY8_BUGNE|nr:hypothetical protein EB796_016550 [Bugula neritina]
MAGCIVQGWVELSSCKPKLLSNSAQLLAPGRSCLLAMITIGTPRVSVFFAILFSSIFASSNLSQSQLSTTNIMPKANNLSMRTCM